jgi:hypothetical protein
MAEDLGALSALQGLEVRAVKMVRPQSGVVVHLHLYSSSNKGDSQTMESWSDQVEEMREAQQIHTS